MHGIINVEICEIKYVDVKYTKYYVINIQGQINYSLLSKTSYCLELAINRSRYFSSTFNNP